MVPMFRNMRRLYRNNAIIKQNERRCDNKCQIAVMSTETRVSDKPKKVHYNIERTFEEFNAETFCSLAKDKSTKVKIAKIIAEYELEKYTTLRVPVRLTIDQMTDLLRCESKRTRRQMMHFFYIKEREIIKNKVKSRAKLEKSNLMVSLGEKNRCGIFDEDSSLAYGLWRNTLFTRLSKQAINKLAVNRLMIAEKFGQKLVIDLDFDQYMKLQECRLLYNQIERLYNYNKYKSVEPFDIHFTNCNSNMPTMEAIRQHMSSFVSPNFAHNLHTQSYLHLFPKSQLVYLTADATETMQEFNANDIYIIGGIVDKTYSEPITYVKAKLEGIRAYRLPIKENILLGGDYDKRLCLNQIVEILHAIKMGGQWRAVLRQVIPKSRHMDESFIQKQDEYMWKMYIQQQKIVDFR